MNHKSQDTETLSHLINSNAQELADGKRSSPSLKEWQVRMQCRKCKDIIYSKYAGEWRTCSCGAIYVDQTPHYGRYGGEPEDFIELDRETTDKSTDTTTDKDT